MYTKSKELEVHLTFVQARSELTRRAKIRDLIYEYAKLHGISMSVEISVAEYVKAQLDEGLAEWEVLQRAYILLRNKHE